jgi:hypothetical protein
MLGEEDVEELKEQAEKIAEYTKRKHKWENAFQKWSDKHGIESDNTEDYGCCGYGSMCDWCTDNSYGRPCVRALNRMCREKRITIDYDNYDFSEVW